MSLFSSYSSFILPLIWAFVAGVFCHLTFSYRRRFINLKERTDKTITRLDQELERSGIVLAETRKKVKELENKLNYYNNGGIDPGIRTPELSSSSGLYMKDRSFQRAQPVGKGFEIATGRDNEVKRRSETTSNDDTLPGFMYAANTHSSIDFRNTSPSVPESVTRSEEKPAYTPYVNSGCSDRTETNYSSSDTGSSSSDSCSSSNND